MPAIRANSVLPARREAITLHTADDLSLVGELALPEDGEPAATLVCLHPLPTHGGMMDSHVMRKAAFRLPALAGHRGAAVQHARHKSVQGTSEGSFDNGEAERYDVAAAIEYAEFHDLPNVWLLGWSFGTDLALMHGNDPAVAGAILLSPPLRFSDHRGPGDLGRVRQAAGRTRARARRLPAAPRGARRFAACRRPRWSACDGAKHLWVGDAETALDMIVERVAPDVDVPLPREWDGPMETADTSAYA